MDARKASNARRVLVAALTFAVVALTGIVGSGTATAAYLSDGCQNVDESTDAFIFSGYTFNAGELLTLQVEYPVAGALTAGIYVNGDLVASTAIPGKASYTFPSTGQYDVFVAFLPAGYSTWVWFCGKPASTLGANGGAVGQSPLRLLLVQCSNVGGGNVVDGLQFGLPGSPLRHVSKRCVAKKLARYSPDQLRQLGLGLESDEYIIVFPDLRGWLADYLAAHQ